MGGDGQIVEVRRTGSFALGVGVGFQKAMAAPAMTARYPHVSRSACVVVGTRVVLGSWVAAVAVAAKRQRHVRALSETTWQKSGPRCLLACSDYHFFEVCALQEHNCRQTHPRGERVSCHGGGGGGEGWGASLAQLSFTAMASDGRLRATARTSAVDQIQISLPRTHRRWKTQACLALLAAGQRETSFRGEG